MTTTITPPHLSTAVRLATAIVLAAIATMACQSPAPPAPATAPAPPPAAATPAPTAAPSDAESPAEYKNTIRWSTASEVENFAYDVYRAESKDGPFERINASPIPGAGTSDETNRYVFVDRDIDPRKEYYYYVESISLAGEREKFTPVSKAKAKIPSDPPAQE